MGPLRTVELNSDHYHLWKRTSGKKTQNKLFFNCLNPPLLYSNQPILLFCPPPTLHINLGIVNLLVQHFFSLHPHLEVKVAEALGILRKDYHDKSFEGRQCSKPLDKCDALALLVSSECLPIIDCLKAFARVTEATFGHRLSLNYEEAIGQFGVNFTRVMS